MGCCHSKADRVHVASDDGCNKTKTLSEHPDETNKPSTTGAPDSLRLESLEDVDWGGVSTPWKAAAAPAAPAAADSMKDPAMPPAKQTDEVSREEPQTPSTRTGPRCIRGKLNRPPDNAAGGEMDALGTGAEERANEESKANQPGRAVVGKSTARESVASTVSATRGYSAPATLSTLRLPPPPHHLTPCSSIELPVLRQPTPLDPFLLDSLVYFGDVIKDTLLAM